VIPAILQLLIFGYAATFEVFNVPTAVLDLDHTQESRTLLADFTNNARFKIVTVAQSQPQAEAAIENGDAVAALVIHAGFANLLLKGQTAPLQVIVDGTNSNEALVALGYVGTIVETFSQQYMVDLAGRTAAGRSMRVVQISVDQRDWYNPNLNSRWFFVPGVIGMLTLMTIVNLTAFAIVREREVGTLEQIMVTPIRPYEFIIGKTVPFFLIGLFQVILVAVTGVLWFHIPFVGSPFVMLLGSSLFLLSSLAIGLLISTLCKTQQQAFASNFFVLNPVFTLSGFAYPIASMPVVLQWLTYINPLRYYLVIIRGTFLKGVGLDILWPDMAALAAIAAVLLTISTLRFHKSLE
jgi:ABC-2 type transport system permease protein